MFLDGHVCDLLCTRFIIFFIFRILKLELYILNDVACSNEKDSKEEQLLNGFARYKPFSICEKLI